MPALFSSLLTHINSTHADLEETLDSCIDDEDLEAAAIDQEEEADALLDDLEVDRLAKEKAFRKLPEELDAVDLSDLAEALKQASEDVIVGKTAQEYRTYVLVFRDPVNEPRWIWKTFAVFCTKNGFFLSPEKLQSKLDNGELDPNLPTYIALFIMHKCDNRDIYTNQLKPLSESVATYGHAQKIRAAMSHKFGRELKLGCQQWEDRDGQCSGNPSLSLTVSQYMISLRRRKVRDGEIVTSARAIDEETIKKLYEFNQSFTEQEYGPRKRKQASADQWAGKDLRTMLHALYVVAFHCLLRFDEALRIEWHWIEYQEYAGGKTRLKVKLPFRKTHQTGGIAPFFLYPNHAKPHLCPVKAISEWLLITNRHNSNLKGFVFRRKVGTKVTEDIEHQMSSGSFMECFRNNLLDIGIDPRPYGTHSFRRGGAQHLVKVRRWEITKVCSWGGWSENGDLATLFKYLLSWNDNTMEREDYFNPEKQRTEPCGECGRTCLCF